MTDNTGLRYDTGKLRYDLEPADAREELIRVYTVGAQKYADRNWEKGMKWSKCLGPLERHLAKWKMGISRDEEYPQLYHMAMVVWNAMALLTYELRGIGIDDVRMTSPYYIQDAETTTNYDYDAVPETGSTIEEDFKALLQYDFFKDVLKDSKRFAKYYDDEPVLKKLNPDPIFNAQLKRKEDADYWEVVHNVDEEPIFDTVYVNEIPLKRNEEI